MKLVTVEQISKWHPDKYADQISDSILYVILSTDPDAHCGIETMVKDKTVVVAGEIKTTISKTQLNSMVKDAIRTVATRLGYRVDKIINLLGRQSVEIDRAVITNDGAGDQGIMVGYSYNKDGDPSVRRTKFAHKNIADSIISSLSFNSGPDKILVGDAKCQVTYDIDTDRVHTIVVSVCHKKGYNLDVIRALVGGAIEVSIAKVAYPEMFKDTKIIINPAGEWNIGGPIADSGLTGRKLVCDAYGPQIPIGGGCQSGKDFTKVDRTAFYMSKFLARVLVDKFSVDDVRVEMAYVIGMDQPASVSVYSSKKSLDGEMTAYIHNNFKLSPSEMIETLKLKEAFTLNLILNVRIGYQVLDYFEDLAVEWVYANREAVPNAK